MTTSRPPVPHPAVAMAPTAPAAASPRALMPSLLAVLAVAVADHLARRLARRGPGPAERRRLHVVRDVHPRGAQQGAVVHRDPVGHTDAVDTKAAATAGEARRASRRRTPPAGRRTSRRRGRRAQPDQPGGLAGDGGRPGSAAKGWTVPAVGNFRGVVPATTVYYPPGQEAAAQAAAESLPTTPRIRPRFGNLSTTRLTVVVTDTYPG